MIQHIILSLPWTMKNLEKPINLLVKTPNSVFDELITQKIIEDPFYGVNEHEVAWVYESTWQFETKITLDPQLLNHKYLLLRFHGIDTFGTVSWNDTKLGTTENMHRTYDFILKNPQQMNLVREENTLQVIISSATKKAREECEQFHHELNTGYPALIGVPYIRKAQYSFGWDWGPQLPDIGIWRPVELIGYDGIRIENVEVHQEHQYQNNQIDTVNLKIQPEIVIESLQKPTSYQIHITIQDPHNKLLHEEKRSLEAFERDKIFAISISHPQIWWIHELGDQPLYTITVALIDDGQKVDEKTQQIGIRDLKLIRTPDKWGETFFFQLNAIPIFAKGADWVPVDNCLPRGKRNGLYADLLQHAKSANMTRLRVWGGGI